MEGKGREGKGREAKCQHSQSFKITLEVAAESSSTSASLHPVISSTSLAATCSAVMVTLPAGAEQSSIWGNWEERRESKKGLREFGYIHS